MKFCTLYELHNGQVGDAVNVMLVLDNHQFGPSDDGLFLHSEGGRAIISPANSGGLSCAICGATKDLVVHHTDANFLNNDPRSLQVVCPEHIPHRDG